MQWTACRRRVTACGAVALALGSAAVATSQAPGLREAAPPPAAAGGLWMSDSPSERGGRLLIVVDPATRHAAVYHVDAASGSLTLRSVRNIGWDLKLDEFNAQEPRPAAIRQMLEAPAAAPVPPRAP